MSELQDETVYSLVDDPSTIESNTIECAAAHETPSDQLLQLTQKDITDKIASDALALLPFDSGPGCLRPQHAHLVNALPSISAEYPDFLNWSIEVTTWPFEEPSVCQRKGR